MSNRAHFTILARNYLPGALALSDSLRRHGACDPLVALLIDATPETPLPALDGVRWLFPVELGLPERTVLELAMSYDLVEFATALKPLVFKALLRDHEQVVYLDPDTYLCSPLVELEPALQAAPIVLTPHFLEPVPPGRLLSEGHLLSVGVYNLGFCAINRGAAAFLDWWWGHLRYECLHDWLSGLFVDQKWMDLGSVMFGASTLRHYGYNVGVGNLHERPIARDRDGYYIASSGDRLRLFHFHAFDPERPEGLYTRLRTTGRTAQIGDETLLELCRGYAAQVLAKRELLGPQPRYLYAHDTAGRRIPRRLRHAYRVAVREDPGEVPSPFVPAEAAAYERWRRRAAPLAARLILSDLAKGLRYAVPEEYDQLKHRFPGLIARMRGRYLEESGLWG
jgi:hypothetical protein